MNGPRRLREEAGSELERALLDAGSSYKVSPETRAKTLAALGLAGAAAMSATAAGAAAAGGAGASSTASMAAGPASLLTKLGWTKLLGGLVTASVVAGVPAGYLIWGAPNDPAVLVNGGTAAVQQRSVTPRESAGGLAGQSVQVVIAAGSAPAQPVERAAPEVTLVRPEADGRGPSQAGPAAALKPEPRRMNGAAALREELTALDSARTRLAGGQPAEALLALDAYHRAHPRGRLRLEAEVLRIEALSRSGRQEVARQRAQTFLRRHPNSVLASRVQRYAGL